MSNTPTGTVIASDINPAAVKDTDGTQIQIVMTGAGHWQLLQGAGADPTLQFTGTNSTTTVTILTSGGDGRFALSDVTVGGSIKAISASKVDLDGNVAISGSITSLVLGNVNGPSTLSVTGSATIAKLSLGLVKDLTVNAAGSIGTLSVQDWSSSASGVNLITGSSIGLLSSAGNFNASLNLSGQGTVGAVLTSASINGTLGGGTWYVKGNVGQISAKTVAQGWRGDVVGAMSQLLTSGDFDGQVAVAVLNSLAVGGNLANADILVGADLGQDATLGGTGLNADTFGQGVLASVRVTGAVTNSQIRVGVDPVDGVYDNGNDVLASGKGSQIQQLVVGGALDTNSLIEARTLPVNVRVNGKTIDPLADNHFVTKPLNTVGIALTGALAVDTGVSASDGITSNPAIKGTAIAAGGSQGIASFTAGLDSAPTSAYVSELASVASNGSFQITQAMLNAMAGGTLADGTHTVHLIAIDKSGAKTTLDITFTLDTAAPTTPTFDLSTASDTPPTGDHATDQSTVTLSGVTTAGTTVTLAPGNGSIVAGTDGTFSFTNVTLNLGANALTATATDLAGNTSTYALTITRTATPTVIIAQLANDTGAKSDDKITSDPSISGTLTKDAGTTIASFTAGFDNAAGNTYANILSTLTNGTFALSKTLINTIAGGTLADGQHVLHLIAKDGAGNTTQLDFSFTLLSAAPAAPVFDLAATDKIGSTGHQTSSANAGITGTAVAGSTVTLGSLTTIASNSGTFQFSSVPLTTGDNVLTVKVIDPAGNTSSASLTVTRVAPTSTTNQSLDWNKITLQAVQNDGSAPEIASRTLAMESIAVYDSLGAINGTPGYYVTTTAPAGASADAATAAAAYAILSYIYPGQQAAFDSLYAAALAKIPDGQSKLDGMVLGKTIADQIIQIRSTDGFNAYTTYDGSTAVGQWRPTAPMYSNAENPQWANLTPFAMTSPSQFRPAGPPDMTSQAYADAVNKTESLGAANSTTRTADETQIARFWADGSGTYTPPGAWNQIAEDVSTAKGTSLLQSAKMFALLNIAEGDAAIAAWDAKYAFGAWRPDTAIQNANQIGNSAITQDSTWQPLLLDPAFPEYISGHSAFSAAAATVLASIFGDNTSFTTTSTSLPGVTRSYTSFSQAAAEAGESRIYGGIHFEFSDQDGLTLGAEVGNWAIQAFNQKQDTQPPRLLIDQPEGIYTNQALSVTGHITDNLSGVASLTVSIDGGTAQAVSFDAKTGAFSVATGLKLDGTADGAHKLVFNAADAAGNAIAPFTFDLTLLTKAPAITLATGSVTDGATLDPTGAYLIGTAKPGAGALAGLSYQIDSGAKTPISFDSAGAFAQTLDLSALATGAHAITLSATDLAGNVTTQVLNVSLPSLVPLTVSSLTPADGAGDIGVTQRPKITFTRAINPATLTSDSFYATDASGNTVAAKIVIASDNMSAYLFFTDPLPGSSNITLHVDGSKIRGAADGTFLDAAGTGTAGSVLTQTFTTVSTSFVANTSLTGVVLDPGPDLQPMTFDDVRAGPDQTLHTADDKYLLPIAGVKVYILGHEDQAVYTDATGHFTLTNVPTGDVKVVLDGTTATNDPANYYFPTMTMDSTIKAGQSNTLMGSMGTAAEAAANATYPVVYLPRVQMNILQTVAAAGTTTVTAVQGSTAATTIPITDAQRQMISLTVAGGSVLDANGNPLANPQVGISTVPAALVKDMLPAGLMQHTFDITIQAPGASVFTTPAQLTMPNVFNLAPGSKTYILSFDHQTGKLVIDGTATVSADGLTVTSDPGSGVTAPGWHGITPAGSNTNDNASGPPATAPGTAPGDSNSNDNGGETGGDSNPKGGPTDGPSPPSTPPKPDDGYTEFEIDASLVGTWNGFTFDAQANASLPSFGTGSEIASAGTTFSDPGLGWLSYAGEATAKLTSTSIALDANVHLPIDPVTFTKVLNPIYVQVPDSIAQFISDDSTFNIVTAQGSLQLTGSVGIEGKVSIGPSGASISGTLGPSLSASGDFKITSGIPYIGKYLNIDVPFTIPLAGLPTKDFTINVPLPASLTPSTTYSTKIGADASISASTSGSGSVNVHVFKIGSTSTAAATNDAVGVVRKLAGSLSAPVIADSSAQQPATADVAATQSLLAATSPTADILGVSTSTGFGTDKSIYYLYVLPDGTEIRGKTDLSGNFGAFLPPNTAYNLYLYQPYTNSSGIFRGTSGESGQDMNHSYKFTHIGGFDANNNGIPDIGDYVLGIGIANSNADGLSDVANLQLGINPAGNSGLSTGVVSTASLTGNAQSIAIAAANDNSGMTAYVASGTGGLAIVDVSNFTKPTVLSQLALSGDSTDVAVDTTRNVAAVITDGTLSLIDISNSAAPKLSQTVTFNDAASRVVLRDGLAYVATGSSISTVNILTGDILQTVDLSSSGGGTLTDLTFDGDTLLTFDTNDTLRAFTLNGELLTARGTLAVPGSGVGDSGFSRSYGQGRISAGGGVVYIEAGNGGTGGYLTVDDSNPDALKLDSDVQKFGIAGTAMALNGSGLGVAVGGSNFVFGGFQSLDVLNVADPTNTGNFVTRINLPSAPSDVAIANGIAFVADGTSGLQVVNYLGFDTKGVAPKVTVNVGAVDRDPNTAGVQVVEGDVIHITPTVTDDVQVRNVELLVDGKVVENDPSYPFSFSTLAPSIATGGTSLSLQVRATDTGGNVTTSDPITLTVVKDTFPPTVVKTSVAENAKLFFAKSIDVTFSKTLDLTQLSAAGVSLVNVGPDGVAGTTDDISVAFKLDTRANGQIVSVLPTGDLPAGTYNLTIAAASIVDHSGNVGTSPVTLDFTIRPASNIKATSGAPAATQAPSANPGQLITVPVPFDPSTGYATFNVIDGSGAKSTRDVQATSYDKTKGTATFAVPIDAVSGDITVYGKVGTTVTNFTEGTFPLQVIPVVTGVSSVSVNGDGTATITLTGLGFVEGNGSVYHIGGSDVSDPSVSAGPDVSYRYDSTLGYVYNGAVTLRVPLGAVSVGAISVTTAGGTSAAFSAGLSSIVATALSGTPANAALASANPGQAVTLKGTGLTTSSQVVLSYLDSNGTQQWTVLAPSQASTDGTSATLQLPNYVNGAFSVQMFGASAAPVLQIVPVVTAVTENGTTLTLGGAGFAEGSATSPATYTIGNASVTDTAGIAGPDVTSGYINGAYTAGNGLVNITDPTHGTGNVTVTTAGGTSAAVSQPVIEPGLGNLGEVAVDTTSGATWVVSGSNPSAITKINPATGATLQTIALPSATFGNTQIGYAGLQIAPAAFTLGTTSVAKGSLLYFNGYNYNGASVFALNPATGAVIASLSLGSFGGYFTSGLYDPTSGHFFLASTSDGKIHEVNAQTGAEVSSFAAPMGVSYSGLAIDPVTGNLWFGSNATTIYQIDRTGTVLKQVDLSTQGFSGTISGLAFNAAGKLLVTNISGTVLVADLGYDPAVKSPTLTSVTALAADGTPLATGVASANVGQAILLTGTNFGAGSEVIFQTRAQDGTLGQVTVAPNDVSADGTTMQVIVPTLAATGNIQVVNVGAQNLGINGTDAIYRKVTLSFTATGATSTLSFGDEGLQNGLSWGLDNVAVSQGATPVFSDTFEGGAKTNWSSQATDTSAPGTFSQFSGQFSNATQKLSLTGLTAGKTYTLSFDLDVLGNWAGTSGSDFFDVTADGTSLMHQAFVNASPYATNNGAVQTYNTSAGHKLQIVPTLNGRSGAELLGSGFQAGATTVTVGGVKVSEPYANQSDLYVNNSSNSDLHYTAPLSLDGPIQVTTDGGSVQIAGSAFAAQPPVNFTGIQSVAAQGTVADTSKASANAGQTITLVGQGFTGNTLVQFAATDDSGTSGVVTRTGTASSDGTSLTIVVPELAKTGTVKVLGSNASYTLQVVPVLRSVGGTVTAGQTIELDGSGLVGSELQVAIDGIGVGTFAVRTISDGSLASGNLPQQVLTLVVPNGVGAGKITLSTNGGSAAIQTGTTIAAQSALTLTGTVDNTLASATALTLGLNSSQAINASTDDAAHDGLNVNLYKVTLTAGDLLNLGLNSSTYEHLRIFDATGKELLSQYTSGTTTLQWTAPAAGTYYIGVSGYYNTSYDPAKANSGASGGYYGTYQLTLARQASGSTTLTGITASATSGTPAKTGIASANTGQTITITGNGLTSSDQVVFTQDYNGTISTTTVTPVSVAADGKSLTVVIPTLATSGMVRLAREQAGIFLQVVPTLGTVTMSTGDGFAGQQYTITGTGFTQDAESVTMGGATLNAVGHYYYNNTQVYVTVPNGTNVATGPISVTTLGGTSTTFQRSLTGITASATSGSAKTTGKASANPGQTITITGTNLTADTVVLFQTIDGNGTVSVTKVNPATVAADGTSAQVVVPLTVVSGVVRVLGDTTNSALALQVIPVVTGVSSVSVNGDGTATITLTGLGFVEGNGSVYHIGGSDVSDPSVSAGPDVNYRYDSVLGYVYNGAVTLRVPLGAVSVGAISVTTAGGTSAAFSAGLSSIVATALSGTPANAALASANPGQAVTLKGTGLTTSSQVVLSYLDSNGTQQWTVLAPSQASTDGTSATLQLPNYVNGAFSVQMFGASAAPVLQIVPVVTAVTENGTTLTLGGAGFAEGSATSPATYTIGNASVTDTAGNAGPDVTSGYINGAYTAGNGLVNITDPTHGTGNVTVTTAGGTSAAVSQPVIDPGLGNLGEVAVDPTSGATWVVSGSNPSAITKINPATGATLQTIALPSATFGNTQIGYAGLQIAPAAFTLGTTSVAKGSLLYFNGYNYNGASVFALNPATGAVIASLSLGSFGGYFTSGLYDPTSGHFFLASTSDGKIHEVNAQTGAEVSSFAAPMGVSYSGLAIDPVTGNLWFGSNATTIYQIDRTGTVLKQVDLSTQGFSGTISGLAFNAAGKLLVTNISGTVLVADLGYDPAVKSPTLTSVTALAADGTPLATGVASANVGQAILLTGTNFGAGSEVIFQTRAQDGTLGQVTVAPNDVSADGTTMQVIVPTLAATGNIQVVNVGAQNLGINGTDAIYRKVTLSFTATGATSTLSFGDEGLQNGLSWGLDNVAVSQGATPVFSDTFEGGAKTNWSSQATDTSAPGTFSQFSGQFSNATQKLSLTGLTAGKTYTLSFDLDVLGNWAGTSGSDFFDVTADGTSLMHQAFVNASPYATNNGAVQTYNTSAGHKLQIVPTLNGRSGAELLGSGFQAGATTVTVGGVKVSEPYANQSDLYVNNSSNSDLHYTAPLSLDGPIQVTTDGGSVQIAGSAFAAQPPVNFTGIQSVAAQGTVADTSKASANAGQTITLVGQGFTGNTLVQFAATDDSGTSGVVTRTGTASSDGTSLTIVVPELAKTGTVKVLGSNASYTLQVVPVLRSVGGTVTAGQTIELDGSGLVGSELQVAIDGIGVGTFAVRTISDGSLASGNLPQQVLTLVVPNGVGAGKITLSTNGGSAAIQTGTTIAAQSALTLTGTVDNTLASATALTLGLNSSQAINASTDDAAHDGLNVNLYKVTLTAGDLLNLGLNSSTYEHLRIFDATGKELLSQYTSGTTTLQWTAPAAGTYYIGVSGYYNTSYDPAKANSGASGGYYGTYQLTLARQASGSTTLTGITASATSGTPAKTGIASANTGQTITITGNGLTSSDQVVFTQDYNGTISTTTVTPVSVAADGKSLTVVIPTLATSGMVRLAREQAGIFLQVVPTLGTVTMSTGDGFAGQQYTITGTGFTQDAESVTMGGATLNAVGHYYYNNTQVYVTVPNGTNVATGPISVTTLGGTSTTFQRSLTGITASATSGSAKTTGKASANPGQTITITGTNLTADTVVLFQTIDGNGTVSVTKVNPATVAADGTSAQVVVPLTVVSGVVRVLGDTTNSALALQVIPVVTGVSSVSVNGDGTATITLTGLGFVEGNGSVYHIGGSDVSDPSVSAGPDVNYRYDSVLGYVYNGAVTLRVPLGAVSVGAISVTTAGGTSAAFSAGLSSIVATALSGTPANAALASANPGQAVTLKGTGLTTSSQVVLSYLDSNGTQQWTVLAPSQASTDGTSATLQLPNYVNGAFSVQMFGASAAPVLQIVPVVTAVTENGTTLTLGGAGFAEGSATSPATYTIGNASVTDTAGNAGPDVTSGYINGAYTAGNGLVNITDPTHGTGNVTVTTAGGTSAAVSQPVIDPGLGNLGEVAVDPTSGATWVVSGSNPSAITKINPATGATLQTIALPSATFGNTQIGYAGLQIAPAAFTLGTTSVAKGSLLYFNGYNYNGASVFALNPATGAVIASLSLGSFGGYFTSGLYDPTSGHFFLASTSDGKIHEVNAQTGAEVSSFAAPMGVSYSGLAIDPVTGNLWFGSNATTIYQIDRTGTVLKQVDLSTQGFSGTISGLAFNAAGKLLVTNISGTVLVADLG
ncbi:Ig-like domain-containing protein [Novosphingobium sp.]|uniref:Ig-like domain-containing protein n=1 Tax=Novosphingobium sp. TaxID=1874826 RepID=UPI003B52FC69